MANDGVAVRSCPRGTKQQPHRPAALRQWRGKRSRPPPTVPSGPGRLLPTGRTRGAPREPAPVARGCNSGSEPGLGVVEGGLWGRGKRGGPPGPAASASAGNATILWGSIAAGATAALGYTPKGKSDGVNGRGCP